ncbi:hypothetical protein [Massilia sp. BSC265]|nr:hypothetical protein [Massilia sp. BSC265]
MDLDALFRKPLPREPKCGGSRSLCHDDHGERGNASVVRERQP